MNNQEDKRKNKRRNEITLFDKLKIIIPLHIPAFSFGFIIGSFIMFSCIDFKIIPIGNQNPASIALILGNHANAMEIPDSAAEKIVTIEDVVNYIYENK